MPPVHRLTQPGPQPLPAALSGQPAPVILPEGPAARPAESVPPPTDKAAADHTERAATGSGTEAVAGSGTEAVPQGAGEAAAAASTVAATTSAGPAAAQSSRPTAGGSATALDGPPKLTRRRDGVILGGVAGGIADHLSVPVLWVRAVFVLLAMMAGSGVVAYALLWIFVPRGQQADRPPARTSPVERRQAMGIAAVGVALLIAGTALGLGPVLGWVLGPLGLAAIGGAFIWREADDARRERWRRTAAGIVGPSKASLWRLIGGCVLVVGGLVVFALSQLEFTAVRSVLIAVLLTLIGVAIITIPWWLRLVNDLGDERRGRIREKERAEIAAHLHDSVLQTLALIQRQPGDSREVQRLARSQERQLRTWLYGPAGYASSADGRAEPANLTFAAALAEAAGEVEDTYAIAMTPVIVGDTGMDEDLAALVAAAREAMVNACKHAGVQEVSVYAEVEDGVVSVFVRDRGVGFDPQDVGDDRRGLAGSIRGRMERHGGTAKIRSTPGAGTEVELTMPVSKGGTVTDSDDGSTAAGNTQTDADAGSGVEAEAGAQAGVEAESDAQAGARAEGGAEGEPGAEQAGSGAEPGSEAGSATRAGVDAGATGDRSPVTPTGATPRSGLGRPATAAAPGTAQGTGTRPATGTVGRVAKRWRRTKGTIR